MAPPSVRLLSALLLLSCTSSWARELRPREREDKKAEQSDAVDRFGHLRVNPRAAFVVSGLLTGGATALQIASPGFVRNTLGAACEKGVGATVLKAVELVTRLKGTHPLGLTMGFGLLLKAVAEVLAQVLQQRGSAVVWLDPLRVVRSTVASLLSSSLSFYYWTRSSLLRGLVAPGWLRALVGGRLGTSIAKMVVTQAIYRPVNVFLFLIAQAFFRGDNARQLCNVIKTKFKGGLIGGIVFFSISNMLMFSVPVPFLHPIMGAIAGLVFNVWLAMVAYGKEPQAAAKTPPAEEPQRSIATSLSEMAHLPAALSDFPATTALLGGVGLVEAAAAAGLYATIANAVPMQKDRWAEGRVPATPAVAETM